MPVPLFQCHVKHDHDDDHSLQTHLPDQASSEPPCPGFRNRIAIAPSIRARRCGGEGENRSAKQKGIREVVDPINLDVGARVGQNRSESDHR